MDSLLSAIEVGHSPPCPLLGCRSCSARFWLLQTWCYFYESYFYPTKGFGASLLLVCVPAGDARLPQFPRDAPCVPAPGAGVLFLLHLESKEVAPGPPWQWDFISGRAQAVKSLKVRNEKAPKLFWWIKTSVPAPDSSAFERSSPSRRLAQKPEARIHLPSPEKSP